jgi:ribonuclease III
VSTDPEMMSNPDGPGGACELAELEAELGYQFDDQALLARAMTHRSYANENRQINTDNQRLEFLGDAVLGVVIAGVLFRADTEAPEGALSSRLSELVCESALVDRAHAIDLGRYIRLGRGEELTGGRQKEGVLADAYEAMLGAIYIDGGHDESQRVILEQFEGLIEEVLGGRSVRESKSPGDFKSLLQREVQSRRPVRPKYRIVETSGPPHERIFVAEVLIENERIGLGEGRSKKEAEQAAAREALRRIESVDGDLHQWLTDQRDQDN